MHEIYKDIIGSFLDKRDSETCHNRVHEALHLAEISPLTLKLLELLAYERKRFSDHRLKVVLGGIEFENPLVAGAGSDKTGRSVAGLHALGFSGVEVGSVLAYPQPGNPKPRQFILGPGVVLNQLGFPSSGMKAVAKNLERYSHTNIPIGINVGINKEVAPKLIPQGYALVTEKLYETAAYFVINVSSPNTPGLRALQDKKPLTDIVQAVNGTMDSLGGRKPLFVKISPELSDTEVNDVIRVVSDNNLTGIIATNTTNRSDLKAQYGEQWRNQAGGLSGNNDEFTRMATQKIAHIYKETGGKMEIIGVGGVMNTQTTLDKIQSGAKIVQIVTGLRGEGPSLPGRINRGLVEYLEKVGVSNISDLVGTKVKL